MKNIDYSHRFVLRATIEFTTPFHIGAGWGGDIADATFVTDANGLPAIPGSSLAGVFREAFRNAYKDETSENRIFGYQAADQGQGSRLTISWACIHDQENRPVEGILSSQCFNDPVLACARNPSVRDHVRINLKGASDSHERGKFDENAVCCGHRFSFEMELTGNKDDETAWERLLALFGDPALRLGGKTRRGFGAFKIIRIQAHVFDLKCDFEAYRSHPISLSQSSPVLENASLTSSADMTALKFIFHITPTGYWMFGGGDDRPIDPGEAKIAPIRDNRIIWKGDKGSVEKDILIIPASGIKGALSHRVAFHYNALSGIFADKIQSQDQSIFVNENNRAVRELFGYSKGHKTKDQTKEEGSRGHIIFDDIYLTPDSSLQLIHHVGIDRFTGGARDQVLFTERPIWKGQELILVLHVTEPQAITDSKVKKALALTLNDLIQERLQVGSGNGRGEGFFSGHIECSPEASRWLSESSDSLNK